MLPVAIVDEEVAEEGEVTIVWGEEDGGSATSPVERHEQVEIRANVHGVPYSDVHDK